VHFVHACERSAVKVKCTPEGMLTSYKTRENVMYSAESIFTEKTLTDLNGTKQESLSEYKKASLCAQSKVANANFFFLSYSVKIQT
jgi:hypothetical protein